jgi:hypothetical protein
MWGVFCLLLIRAYAFVPVLQAPVQQPVSWTSIPEPATTRAQSISPAGISSTSGYVAALAGATAAAALASRRSSRLRSPIVAQEKADPPAEGSDDSIRNCFDDCDLSFFDSLDERAEECFKEHPADMLEQIFRHEMDQKDHERRFLEKVWSGSGGVGSRGTVTGGDGNSKDEWSFEFVDTRYAARSFALQIEFMEGLEEKREANIKRIKADMSGLAFLEKAQAEQNKSITEHLKEVQGRIQASPKDWAVRTAFGELRFVAAYQGSDDAAIVNLLVKNPHRTPGRSIGKGLCEIKDTLWKPGPHGQVIALEGYTANKLFASDVGLADVWQIGQAEMARWLLDNDLRLLGQ